MAARTLGLIGCGMMVLDSARPLWGLVAFLVGMGHGMDQQKKKEIADKAEA